MTDPDSHPNDCNLAIAYRVYPGLGRSGPVFNDDKYRRVELCLKSFKAALGDLKVKIHVILDGCPPVYQTLFSRHFEPEELEIVACDRVGNQKTFIRQIEWLCAQNASELVYFAEDDYFYFPDALKHMLAVMREQPGVDFLTPHDHLDYHQATHHGTSRDSFKHRNIKWKSVASTCLTFMTRKEILQATRDTFQKYAMGCSDVGLWFALTRFRLFEPDLYLQLIKGNRHAALAVVHGWWYGRPGLGKNRKGWNLWAPEPTLAAHLENQSLPPGVDWKKVLDQAAMQLDDQN